MADASGIAHEDFPATGSAGRSRRWQWLFAAKLLASVVLLGWILERAGLAEIFAAVASANIPLLLASFGVRVFGTFLPVIRWHLLLRTQGVALSYGALLKSYLVGIFFNNFLPSTVGGDASRAYDCYRMSGRSVAATSSVLVDRLLGMAALVVLALVALPFATHLTDRVPSLPVWLGFAVVALAGVIGTIFFRPAGHRLAVALTHLPGILRIIRRLAQPFALYRGRWRVLIAAFGLSLLIQFCAILFFILAARALGVEVPPVDFFVIVPLLMVVVMLPVSINGIGLREGALVAALALYGVAPADAVALAWLDYAAVLVLGLIGGVIYGLRRSLGGT